jgi:uncharacterized protein (TIGR00251 family)
MYGPLIQTDDGVRLLVRAIPKAHRDEIVGVRGGRLLIKVTTAPEGGKANQAIVKLLCKKLGLRRTACRLVQGATSHNKAFLLEEIKLEDIVL